MWRRRSTVSSGNSPVVRWEAEQFAFAWSVLVFLVNTVGLVYFHFGHPWMDALEAEGGQDHLPWMQRILSGNDTTRMTILPKDRSLYETTFDSSSSSLQMRWLYPTQIDMILFSALIVMAFELLDFITKHVGQWFRMKQIPVRGKHLDVLRPMDVCCIAFSKANTAPFTYLYLRYCYFSEYVLWDISPDGCLSAVSMLQNVLVPLMVLFLCFDFTYSIFHCILHISWIYPFVHKHHHIQKAPSRANVDAVNVHPVEFLGGEYNHLLVLYVYTAILQQRVHILATLLFLVVGGLLAGMNHTRYDVTISIPIPNVLSVYQEYFTKNPSKFSRSPSKRSLLYYWTIYDSKAHDVHHRIPQSNYGQYLMIWDYLFGTYRPYNPNDRVNPDSQLDPKTGMTRNRR